VFSVSVDIRTIQPTFQLCLDVGDVWIIRNWGISSRWKKLSSEKCEGSCSEWINAWFLHTSEKFLGISENFVKPELKTFLCQPLTLRRDSPFCVLHTD
jgi:hypothetical protein